MTHLNLVDQKMEGTTAPQADHSRKRSSMSHPASGSVDDNDNSEKSAREKLKKASLGSLGSPSGHEGLEHSEGQPLESPPIGSVTEEDFTISRSTEKSNRGRPQRKRSYEDFEKTENEDEMEREDWSEYANNHARKRSRDIKLDRFTSRHEIFQAYDRDNVAEESIGEAAKSPTHIRYQSAVGDKEETLPALAVSADHGGSSSHRAMNTNSNSDARLNESEPSYPSKSNHTDQHMEGGAHSPRKKRSRDQFDPEVDREQKIAATEGARALRLSNEIDRVETTAGSGEPPTITRTSQVAEGLKLEPSKNVFGSPSRLTASAARPSPASSTRSLEDKVISQSAFASGFAALVSSATSPFGNIGATASSESAKFSKSISDPNQAADEASVLALETGVPAGAGFDSLGGHHVAASRPLEPSPFTVPGPTKLGVFGGSVFGAGFGGGFGAGNKLTSFATPTGDTKLRSNNGSIKPIGASDNPDMEDPSSESQDSGEEVASRDDNADEVDERFQQQDGMFVYSQKCIEY